MDDFKSASSKVLALSDSRWKSTRFLWNEGMGKPLWKINEEKQMAHKNKTNKMERCTNRVHVQQNLIIELQISKWNLCEKFVKRNVVALGVYTVKLAKEKATGAVYSLGVWKKTVQWTVQEVQPGSGSSRAVRGATVRIALFYYCIHRGLYTGTVHSVQQYWST
jgi:hypothetical protein